ncbi:hypothetical protein BH18ACT7_BH18ACT7_24580 [soil metagenome]
MIGLGTRAARSHPLLEDPSVHRAWAGRAAERLADWILLVAAIASVWQLTASALLVVLIVVARLLPRAVLRLWAVPTGLRVYASRLYPLMTPMRAVLAGGLVLVADDARGVSWLLGLLVLYGVLSALSDAVRTEQIAALVSRIHLGGAARLDSAIERSMMVLGTASAALILTAANVQAAFAAAGLLLAGASVLALEQARRVARGLADPLSLARVRDGIRPTGGPAWDLIAARPSLILMAGAALAGGALATSLTIALVAIITERLDGPLSWLGWSLAAVGTGALMGPFATARMLAHFPASLLVAGAVVVTALGVILAGLIGSPIVVLAILFTLGLVAVNGDAISATVTRRLTPSERLADTSRAMVAATACGQVVGALAIVVASPSRSVTEVLLVIGIASVVLMGALLVVAEGARLMARQAVS